jgi:hypothetical protein
VSEREALLTALVRIGLAVLLTLTPALCCCNTRWVSSWAVAASPAVSATVTPSRPVPTCPHCRQAEELAPAPVQPGSPVSPPGTPSPHCVFCDGQGSVILPESPPQPDRPAFSGELVPVAGFDAVLPVNPSSLGGAFPPGRAGVDARWAALVDRHVMHC